MKQKMILTACLAVLGMLSVKAQQSIIALHHQGNVTIFADYQTKEAMDASEDGDTLYLSTGVFSNITITKPVTIIGSGMETFVRDVIVSIPDSVTLTKSLCQNIRIYNLNITDTITGVSVSQCEISNATFNALTKSSYFISCQFGTFTINYNIQGMQVLTSRIWTVRGQTNVDNLKFVNCSFNYIENHWEGVGNGGCMATYINCILGNWQTTNGWYHDGTTYVNCLLHLNGNEEVFKHSTRINCWTNTTFSFDSDFNCSLSDSLLHAAGYVGEDGTVVGCTGTTAPFTLELATPHVVEPKINVDNVNRKMTVTLKMAHDANKKEEE